MKKSLLAVGLTLAMVLTMATPAFAAISTEANKNSETTAVTAPGNPGVAQVAKESYNAATMNSADGAKWTTANDDDAIAVASDTAADINVWAKVVDSGSKVYKVDLAWGAMKFEYNSKSGQWNTTDHKYDAGGGTGEWTVATYLDGTNNKVAITNHSNNAIDAKFAYAMDGTNKFNEVAGKDNVVGNFFDTKEKAATAATKLVDTYDATGATATDVPTKLAGPVALATADAYNSSATPPTTVTDNKVAGARTSDVFFAFSGTPDSGKGKVLDTFKKVGVITVTVTPNNELPLNQAPYKAP